MSLRTISNSRLIDGVILDNLPDVTATPGGSDNFLRSDGQWGSPIDTGVTYVSSMSDFPEAVGGVITLPTGVYQVSGALITSDRFVIAENAAVQIKGLDANIDSLTYTGSGNFISSDSKDITSFQFLELFIIGSVPGTCFDIQCATAFTGSVFLLNTGFTGFGGMGTGKNLLQVAIDFNLYYYIGDGFILDSCFLVTSHLTNYTTWQNNSTSMFTFVNSIGTFVCNTNSFDTGTNESVVNIPSGFTDFASTINGNTYLNTTGEFFKTGGLDQTSIYITAAGNRNLPNSAAFTEIYITSAAATVIGAIDTLKPIAGTWADDAERFTTDADGIMTYIGLEDISIGFAGSLSVTGGSLNQDIVFYFAHGNATGHAITAFADAGGGQVTVTSAGHGISNGDRVYIKGTTNYNGDFIVSNVTTDTYEITDTWVSDDATGEWQVMLAGSKQLNTIASTTKASNTSIQTRITFKTGDTMQAFLEGTSHATSPTAQTGNITTSI